MCSAHRAPTRLPTVLASTLLLFVWSFSAAPAATAQPVLKIEYRVQIDDHPMLTYGPMELAAPVLSPDGYYVVVGAQGGQLHLLRTEDGRSVFSRELDGGISAQPLVLEDKLIVGTEEGTVHMLGFCDGQPLWKEPARVQGAVRASPVLWKDQTVFVQDDKSVLYAISLKDGSVLYTFAEESFAERGLSPFTIFSYPAPLVSGDSLYAGFETGRLNKFTLATASGLTLSDFEIAWAAPLCDPDKRTIPEDGRPPVCSPRRFFTDVDTTPVLTEKGLLGGCFCNGLSLLDPLSGSQRWHQAIRGPSTPLLAGNYVYLTAADGAAYSLKLDSGEVVWTTQLEIAMVSRPGLLGHPNAPEASVLAVASGKQLYFLDLLTGNLLERLKAVNGFSAAPATAGNTLFVVSNEGYLYRMVYFR